MKKQAGKAVEQTPLPDGEDVPIDLPTSESPESGVTSIVVPAVVTRYHPLVEQARQVLKTLKPGDAMPSVLGAHSESDSF